MSIIIVGAITKSKGYVSPDRRPADGQPLVLLDSSDLTGELLAIQERLASSRSEEERWLSSLTSNLSDL